MRAGYVSFSQELCNRFFFGNRFKHQYASDSSKARCSFGCAGKPKPWDVSPLD